MEQCLIDNKVCSVQGQKCKECKLDDCRRTVEMIETQEEREEDVQKAWTSSFRIGTIKRLE